LERTTGTAPISLAWELEYYFYTMSAIPNLT